MQQGGASSLPVTCNPDEESTAVYFKEGDGRNTNLSSFLAGEARPLASTPYPGPAMGTNLNGRSGSSEGATTVPRGALLYIMDAVWNTVEIHVVTQLCF